MNVIFVIIRLFHFFEVQGNKIVLGNLVLLAWLNETISIKSMAVVYCIGFINATLCHSCNTI